VGSNPTAKPLSKHVGRRVLKAMLVAAAFCIVVDVAFGYLLPPSAERVYYRTARAFVEETAAPDIQIVGDSAAGRGLIAQALAASDDVSVRNDALSGTRLAFTYYLLRRQFERGRIPSAIVLAHTLSFDDSQADRLAATFLDSAELPEALAATTHWADSLYAVLSRYSYVLMNRQHFRALIVSGNYGFFVASSDENQYEPHSDEALFDAYLSGAERALAPERFEEIRRIRPFHVDDEADGYLRKLLALAKRHDVKVFWLTMPVPAVVAEAYGRFDTERELLAYLRQFEQRGELTTLEARFSVYDNDLFADTVHATPAGAVRFSCDARRFAPILREAVRSTPHAKSTVDRADWAKQRGMKEKLADACAE
jgi:hypothetical protein